VIVASIARETRDRGRHRALPRPRDDRDGKWVFLVLNWMGTDPGRVPLIALS
jgi:hypothetical protein